MHPSAEYMVRESRLLVRENQQAGAAWELLRISGETRLPQASARRVRHARPACIPSYKNLVVHL